MSNTYSVDLTEYFKKVASTYSDHAIPMREVSAYALSICPPITNKSVVLDDGCGPGTTVEQILKQDFSDGKPTSHAVDFSEPMIEELRKKKLAGVEAAVMDARDLKFADNTFTHAFMMFVLMAIPDNAEKAAVELHRTLQAGGTATVALWHHISWFDLFKDVEHTIRPDAPSTFEPPLKGEWMREGKLQEVLQTGGFERENIQVTAKSVLVDAKILPKFAIMIEGIKKSMTLGWTEEEKARFDTFLNERMEKDREDGVMYEQIAFVALAKK